MAFDGGSQAVTGLHHKPGSALQIGQQRLELGAVHGAACRHHANVAGGAERYGGLEGRLDTDHRQRRKTGAHLEDGGCGGGIAGYHQRFDVVLDVQVLGDGVGAGGDERITLLAIRRKAIVREVNEVLSGQLFTERL